MECQGKAKGSSIYVHLVFKATLSTLATDELLCDKNAGAQVSMVSYLKKQINEN